MSTSISIAFVVLGAMAFVLGFACGRDELGRVRHGVRRVRRARDRAARKLRPLALRLLPRRPP